jgi:hypothetical protein
MMLGGSSSKKHNQSFTDQSNLSRDSNIFVQQMVQLRGSIVSSWCRAVVCLLAILSDIHSGFYVHHSTIVD